MIGDILHYDDITEREKTRRQRGMNFRMPKNHSMILMSTSSDAPYQDTFDATSGNLIYSGHDVPTNINPKPKSVDQSLSTPKGKLTENGLFFKAAMDYMSGDSSPQLVQVYEKSWMGCGATKDCFISFLQKLFTMAKETFSSFTSNPLK